jgi:hypothetical protein
VGIASGGVDVDGDHAPAAAAIVPPLEAFRPSVLASVAYLSGPFAAELKLLHDSFRKRMSNAEYQAWIMPVTIPAFRGTAFVPRTATERRSIRAFEIVFLHVRVTL